jgi:hypothetical protein
MTTLVTDPVTGQSNSSFIASHGNPVPKAGIFYNGPDKGPSDLAVDHTFSLYGLARLPWKMDFSGNFRAQSGFHYSASFAANPPDADGDNNFNGLDRIARQFDWKERVKLHVYVEVFNLFNRQNPAAVNGLPPASSKSSAPQIRPSTTGSCGPLFQKPHVGTARTRS